MNKKIAYLSIIFFVGLLFSSCSLNNKVVEFDNNKIPEVSIEIVDDSESEVLYSGQMKKFSNYNELASFLEEELVVLPGHDSHLDDGNSLNTATSYSLNGEQEINVNQADILKTEGEYIYFVSHKDLFIIKASEDSIQVLSKLTFYSSPSEIYVKDGKLIVIGVDNEIMDAQVYKNFSRQVPYTFVKIFDLENPLSPVQIRDLDFEGSYLASRFVDKQFYLILDNFDDYLAGEPMVPRLVDEGRILPSICSDDSACFAPTVYYFDIAYDNYHFVSINNIDLNAIKEPVSAQSYILNSAQNIYVSDQNVYLTYAKDFDIAGLELKAMQSILDDKLSEDELAQISKIKASDNLVLNKIEKREKLEKIYNNFLNNISADELLILETRLDSFMQDELSELSDAEQETLIYKLNLGGELPVYQAKGSVPGIIDSSLFMNEDLGGNLQLITSVNKKNPLFSGERTKTTSFHALSSQLNLLSSIEDISSDENLKSIRFLGDRIYLSASELTSDFYVLDVSQIKYPKLLGNLNLSNSLLYLYPYNGNNLISLGENVQIDVYGNKKFGGIKVSLFDVSDVNNPLELDSYSIGSIDSSSLSLYNYQDFLFKENKSILAVPVSLTANNNSLANYFDGALFFNIEEGKLILRDKVDHSDGGKYQLIDNSCQGVCYDSSVKRIININDLIYTFSNKYIKVNDSNDFSLKQVLKLMADTEVDISFVGIEDPDNSLPLEDESGVLTEDMSPIGPSLLLEEEVVENDDIGVLSDFASSSEAIISIEEEIGIDEIDVEEIGIDEIDVDDIGIDEIIAPEINGIDPEIFP